MSKPWSPDKEATLRRLWREGLSANQIAKELGPGFSRNSVIGKAVRLGLRGHKTPGHGSAELSALPVSPAEAVEQPAKISKNEKAVLPALKLTATAKGSPKIPLPAPATHMIPKRLRGAAARLLRRKNAAREEQKASERRAIELAEKRALAARAAREEAERLAAIQQQKLDSRLKYKRMVASRVVEVDKAPFEALRKKWLSALMYLHQSERKMDADGEATAKDLIAEVEAEWSRLTELAPGNPGYFKWPTTEPHPGDGKVDYGTWAATGMFRYLGYRVGKTSELCRRERELLLSCIFRGPLPPINGPDYIRGWGPSGSERRLQKMAESIAAFARLRKQRRDVVAQEAVGDWEDDLRYLHRTYYVGRFGFAWPIV